MVHEIVKAMLMRHGDLANVPTDEIGEATGVLMAEVEMACHDFDLGGVRATAERAEALALIAVEALRRHSTVNNEEG